MNIRLIKRYLNTNFVRLFIGMYVYTTNVNKYAIFFFIQRSTSAQ